MARPIRLFHAGTGKYFIVSGETVFADLDGDGRISRSDRYAGAECGAVLAAARFFDAYFEAPFPGAASQDSMITSGGRINAREAAQFEAGPPGIPARRSDIMAHLDFFDRLDGDGMISLRENFRGWRALGYPLVKSAVLTLGSALVFGRPGQGFAIDVERIAEKRPKGSTRIYGPDGNIDRARLAEFAAAFDADGAQGTLTHDQLRAALARRASLGTVPRRQFESLLLLTQRLNGSPTVTKDQFIGLFDNTLFWRAASIPDNSGKRRL